MKMSWKVLQKIQKFLLAILLLVSVQANVPKRQNIISLSSSDNSDLYITLKENKIPCNRYKTPEEAIENAHEGSGVMILAEGYPEQTTVMDSSLFEKARSKNLRLYLEYPSFLPGMKLPPSRPTSLERVVVSTDLIENLTKMQILAIHDCNYIPVSVENPFLSVSKVAGFDYAIYGIEDNSDVGAILFELQPGNLLVSTTKLSQFIKARYAPKESMQALLSFILKWTQGNNGTSKKLEWTPDVRPSYTREEKLPENAARLAVKRGIDWHSSAKMLLNEQGWEEYKQVMETERLQYAYHCTSCE